MAATDAELTSTPYLKSQPLHIYLLRAGSTIAELISRVSVPGARAEGIVLGAPGQGCVGAPGAVYARTENQRIACDTQKVIQHYTTLRLV